MNSIDPFVYMYNVKYLCYKQKCMQTSDIIFLNYKKKSWKFQNFRAKISREIWEKLIKDGGNKSLKMSIDTELKLSGNFPEILHPLATRHESGADLLLQL